MIAVRYKWTWGFLDFTTQKSKQRLHNHNLAKEKKSSTMRRMTCIVVLVCTAYYQNTNLAAIPFSKTDVEFASIPFDQIPFDVTSIDLGGNNLSDITFFPPFAQLSTLSIYDQPNVTVFPNLENISEPLVDLAIMRCSLSYIEPYRLQILTNLENLNLVANLLTSPFPDMNPALGCNLLQLNLHKNRLHEMPHLHTIAKSLKVLNLGNNLNIGHLPKETLGLYRELTSMQCGICSLRSIPDFSLLAEVHRGPSLSIRLRNNHITSIHAEDLRPVIGRSWTLDIKSNPIKHIMNMLHLRTSNQLSMRNIPVLCDCRLRWLKAAGQHQKTAVAFETVECDGPGSTTVKLQDTPYEHLVCNGKSASITDKKTNSYIYLFLFLYIF